MIEIIVNGESRKVPTGTSVAQLVTQLGLQARYVAIEKNLELVPRARHAECPLQAGDRLEIVTLVGGG